MNRVCRNTLVALGCAVLGLAALPAPASVTLFTDRTAFTAATGGVTLTALDFAPLAPANSIGDFSTASGLTMDGVNFVGRVPGVGYRLYAVDPGYYITYQGWPGNPTVLQDGSGDTANLARSLDITLPGNVTAVGMDLYTVALGDGSSNTVSPVTLTLSTGDVFTVDTFSKPTLAFAGLLSSSPISSISLTSPTNTFLNLSGFVFGIIANGPAPAVPEPGGLVLMIAGSLSGIGFLARCRKK